MLQWTSVVDVGSPAAGEVRLAHSAIGLNYIDVYHRNGLYPQPLPFVPGVAAAGVIEAVGEGVDGVAPGDRVAYAGVLGSYSETRLAPADRLVKLPDSITDLVGAGMLLQGMTAEFLIHRTYPVAAGDWVLFHAAAGGVGSIAVQWLRALGAIVIGTAGSPEKCAIVKSLGANHVINYRAEKWIERVKSLTDGKGAHVVYDGVGRDTCVASMDCLRPRGHLVTFGNASGPVPAIEPLTLAAKHSIYLTRPALKDYIATRADLELSASAVFDVLTQGHVKAAIGRSYPLREAAQAHRDLEERRTTGSTVFTI